MVKVNDRDSSQIAFAHRGHIAVEVTIATFR
jgi:hypothetical protein